MSPLRVEASLVGPVARSGPAPVTVTVTNVSDAPVLVNRRLAPGYRDSSSRELWADVRDESGAPAAVSTIDYERELPAPEDYGELAPQESVAGEFDLFHYARPRSPGRYEVTVVYQADEAIARPPAGTVAGEHAADPIAFVVDG
jgi:hypothetical protein